MLMQGSVAHAENVSKRSKWFQGGEKMFDKIFFFFYLTKG